MADDEQAPAASDVPVDNSVENSEETPAVQAGDSVPGTDDVAPSAESLVTEVQPPAPVPVPATSGVAQDQVSVNGYLHHVAEGLQELVVYVENFLKDHPAAENLVTQLTDLAAVALENVK